MSQLRLFLSRFLLCIWVVLFGSFLFLVLFEARGGGMHSPMAGVYLNAKPAPIHLPNRIFTCTELEQGTQCQAEVYGRSLVLALLPDSNPDVVLSNCQAQYDAQPVTCSSTAVDYAPALSESIELDTLGLNAQQLQALRRRYWGVNALLSAGEPKLIRISWGLAIAAGAIAAFWAWFHPSWLSKGWVAGSWGVVAYQLMWTRLASVPYDAVTPYGITTETWEQVVSGSALAAGVVVALAIIGLLRTGQHYATKAIVTLSGGLGAALIGGYTLILLLLGTGFVD